MMVLGFFYVSLNPFQKCCDTSSIRANEDSLHFFVTIATFPLMGGLSAFELTLHTHSLVILKSYNTPSQVLASLRTRLFLPAIF